MDCNLDAVRVEVAKKLYDRNLAAFLGPYSYIWEENPGRIRIAGPSTYVSEKMARGLSERINRALLADKEANYGWHIYTYPIQDYRTREIYVNIFMSIPYLQRELQRQLEEEEYRKKSATTPIPTLDPDIQKLSENVFVYAGEVYSTYEAALLGKQRELEAEINQGVPFVLENNPRLAAQVYKALGYEVSEEIPSTIASTLFELKPGITEEKIGIIYDNYVKLMGRHRQGKEMTYDAFRSLIHKYQVYNYRDTYIFGQYDPLTATFITRVNSSPTSKELLAEAIPNIVNSGLDFISFVPKDYADRLSRSGYTSSKSSFEYDFKGEQMQKFALASNPKVFEKIFNKSATELTAEEIEAYNEKFELSYTPVEIKSPLIRQAGKELSSILETYLNQFGIVVKDIEEIKDKLKIDEVGFADIISKIAYVKDKKDLPAIAGEFIAYMMQHNELVKDIIVELAQVDRKDGYKNLDKAPYFKIIGELIVKDLQNKLEGNYNKSLILKIRDLVNRFFALFKSIDIPKINTNIGIITQNILQQNKKLITASLYKPGAPGKPTKQVDIESALKKDKFGAKIIYALAKQGFILTGSTAISEQGTILRPDENPLHDIDWVSPFSRKETYEKFLKTYPDAIKIREIFGDGYVTDSFIIAPEGYSISNLQINEFQGKSIIVSYDVIDSGGNIAGTFRYQQVGNAKKPQEIVDGIEAKVIDFFSYEDYGVRNRNPIYPYQSEEGTIINLANWRDVFQAKLEWARYKDVWDYNRFVPNAARIELKNQQKIKAQRLYSKYLETTTDPTIDGFKKYLSKNVPIPRQEVEQYPLFPEIVQEEEEAIAKEIIARIQSRNNPKTISTLGESQIPSDKMRNIIDSTSISDKDLDDVGFKEDMCDL